MISRWRILPLGNRPRSVPQLLAKYTFDVEAGYTIYLTDLTRIWSETLDCRQIIKRGLEEDTSIDPSEDASQLKILLDKVRTAIQGAEGTFLELLPREEGDGLVVKANVTLPPPLKPLIWPIYLEPSAQELLTEMLVLPMLGYHLALRDGLESLVGQVKSKDRVIDKLLDKMELSGMDLGSIFPGIAGLSAGKKGGRWGRAEKLVRGLGPFNEEAWVEEMEVRARGARSEKEVLDAIFGSNGAGPVAVVDRELTKPDSTKKWWENLDGPSKGGNAGPENIPTSGRTKARTPEGCSDDEFQTQKTPPHLEKTTNRQTRDVSAAKNSTTLFPKSPPAVDNDTTDDDLDTSPLTTPPSRPIVIAKTNYLSPQADSSSEEAVSPRKRAAWSRAPKVTGGLKPNIKEQVIAEEPKPDPPTKHEISGSETETTSDGGENVAPAKAKPLSQVRYRNEASPERRSPPKPNNEVAAVGRDKSPDSQDETSPEFPPPKPKGRLGAIGGIKKAPIPDVNSGSSRAVVAQPPKPKAQLGMIRGKKKAPTPDAEPPGEPSQGAATLSPKPKPRLGVIGKKERVFPENITETPIIKSSRGGKLGLVGGRGGAQKTAAYKPSHSAGERKQVGSARLPEGDRMSSSSPPSPQLVKAPTPPPLETEEEKANRRRDELKRQLDAKSKAPAKKKRKF